MNNAAGATSVDPLLTRGIGARAAEFNRSQQSPRISLLVTGRRAASCPVQQHALITCPLMRQKKSAGERSKSGNANATRANQAKSRKAFRERRTREP